MMKADHPPSSISSVMQRPRITRLVAQDVQTLYQRQCYNIKVLQSIHLLMMMDTMCLCTILEPRYIGLG